MVPTIKDYVDDTDLRTINWRKQTLRQIAKEWDLQPGEVVVFENSRRNKARMVLNTNGMPVLLLPYIDPKNQLSTHLEINRFLHEMANESPLNGTKKNSEAHIQNVEALVERHEDLQRRIAIRAKAMATRRRNRAAKAAKRKK